MRILTRYILGEILSHTLIGGALFTFILFMRELPHLLEMMVRNSSTFTNVLEIFLFTLPNTCRVTIPMAVLVGVLLGLSRLAADSEIIAMRASGLGIGYFVRVSAIVAIAGTILGLVNSLYIAPRANQAILELQQELETSQASYEIQPRVFYEDFKNMVLYVQDVRAGAGASNWRQVFMADVSDPATPAITTAASATVTNDSTQELLMRLRDGSRHEMVANQPQQYNISTFATTDMPLVLSQQSAVQLGRLDTAIYALPMRVLQARTTGQMPNASSSSGTTASPFPLPASSSCSSASPSASPPAAAAKAPASSSPSSSSVSTTSFPTPESPSASRTSPALPRRLVRQHPLCRCRHLSPLANGLRRTRPLCPHRPRPRAPHPKPEKPNGEHLSLLARWRNRARPRKARHVFPRILDEYVVREFLTTFFMVLTGFVMLMLVFTSFELIGDMLRNHIPITTLGDYLVNLTPSMLYQIAPLAVLIAVLVTFGVLNRNSELIAMKATGISLYRLVVPIVAISATLAVSLFLFDQFYLPQANRRQEALRSIIKGRPPQTFLHPEQNGSSASPTRRTRPHLLLPVLRSGPRPVCQLLHLRVRSRHLCPLTAYLCRSRHMGPRQRGLDLRERLAARYRGAECHRITASFRAPLLRKFTRNPPISKRKASSRRR